MAHTPGPWVVGGPYPKITVCQPAAFDDPWIPIAEVWPSADHEASDEVKANARLIVAAPPMLKILKEIHYVIEQEEMICPSCGILCCSDDCELAEIITKAEGE